LGDGNVPSGHAGRARAELTICCGSPEEAEVLWRSLSADDPGSVEGRVEGSRLVLRTGPAPIASVRTTLDDLLACAQAASLTVAFEGTDEGEVV
jgi:hypothetical protein